MIQDHMMLRSLPSVAHSRLPEGLWSIDAPKCTRSPLRMDLPSARVALILVPPVLFPVLFLFHIWRNRIEIGVLLH